MKKLLLFTISIIDAQLNGDIFSSHSNNNNKRRSLEKIETTTSKSELSGMIRWDVRVLSHMSERRLNQASTNGEKWLQTKYFVSKKSIATELVNGI